MGCDMWNAVEMKWDRPTVLMADVANLSGQFSVWYSGNWAKRFHVSEWNQGGDSLSWGIESSFSGKVNVTALIKGDGAEVQLSTGHPIANIRSGEQKLTKTISTNWNRVDLGIIHLKAGINTVTLSSSRPGGGLELYSLELVSPDIRLCLEKQAVEMRSDTSWMRESKYGLQFHWTSESQPRYGKQKVYADAVRAFDVQSFAQMVNQTGAGYIIFTTSHAEHYFPAPIKSIDAIMPGRTSDRDLVQDLIGALGAYGIRLMLYYHVGHDHWVEPDGWWTRTGFAPDNPNVFISNWCVIMTEIGERYGEGLAGWFYDDGCVYYPLNPDFRQLGQAAKAGNSSRVICYNPWIWPRFTDFQDYFCGEGYSFLKNDEWLPGNGSGIFTDGPHKSLQAHTNFILEKSWCHSTPAIPISPPQIPKDEFLQDMVNAIKRGIVPSVNLEIYQNGSCSDVSTDYMRAIKATLT